MQQIRTADMKFFLISLISFSALSSLSAQTLQRFVSTGAVNDRMGLEYSEYWTNRVAIEQQTQEFLATGTQQTFSIPLVFHIVLPDSIQITAAQINGQIASLNADFNGQTFLAASAADLAESFYDSITLAGRFDMFSRAVENTGISFCVAQTDAQGNPATGVDFASYTNKTWTFDDAVKRVEEGGLPAWDARKYLNVWVCRLADSVSGYAQMPGGPWPTDGIVIDYRFFGRGGSSKAPFNRGKTLTHLVGNYLNLFDLWSDTFRCQDDNVSDTPVHNAPNTGGNHFRHISTCDGQPMEMIMNFMDNMDDSCMYMFTQGQAWRMQAILAESGWRSGLTQWANNGISCSTAPFTNAMLRPDSEADSRNTVTNNHVDLFQVVPNPANTKVTISLFSGTEQNGSIRIATTTGTEVFRSEYAFVKGANAFDVDCSHWPRGIYVVVLNTGSRPLSRVLVVD